MDIIERNMYSIICKNEGIKAREIGKQLGIKRGVVNHYLYGSPYMKELCYQDKDYKWYGLIRQTIPHRGLEEFSGYYSYVEEFLDLDYDSFFVILTEGCKKVGRNLNDTRGLFHSFEETYYCMQELFESIRYMDWSKWEILFELRIKRAKYIRIYADVVVITDKKVFSLEFKMKGAIEEPDVKQAAKYCEYLEVLFGPEYDVIPALVLTSGEDIYEERELPQTTAIIPVCSGNQLGKLMAEYLN